MGYELVHGHEHGYALLIVDTHTPAPTHNS
jgi:hypothetical protein